MSHVTRLETDGRSVSAVEMMGKIDSSTNQSTRVDELLYRLKYRADASALEGHRPRVQLWLARYVRCDRSSTTDSFWPCSAAPADG